MSPGPPQQAPSRMTGDTLTMPRRLTRATMMDAAKRLAARDPDLARILHEFGPPPLWARRAGFPTLVQIILEQQVSLASGRAAFERLSRQAGRVTPEHVQTLGPTALKAAGLTRQKSRYLLELSNAITSGRLDLRAIGRMDDDGARDALTIVPGIGPWTADIYLLMALRREDVWPTADLALRHSMRELRGLRRTPTDGDLQEIALQWRPYRSVATRLLWHSYLACRGR